VVFAVFDTVDNFPRSLASRFNVQMVGIANRYPLLFAAWVTGNGEK
jgi:hypothetical protein